MRRVIIFALLLGVSVAVRAAEPAPSPEPEQTIETETEAGAADAWEAPRLFFSVDIYTCKAFDPADAARFTARYFSTSDLVVHGF